MAEFDFSNFKNHKAAYIIMIITVLLVIVYIHYAKMRESKGYGIPGRKTADGNGTAYYHGRGGKGDSVSELLDRIDWSSYLEKRITMWYRMFMVTVIAIALIVVIVLRKLPTPPALILLSVSIFIPFYASHQLHYVHGDIYNDYYIRRNVRLLRAKLGLKRFDVPEPPDKIPSRTRVMNPK